MVVDYSEKRGGREKSVERKPVQKNRPRKEPVGLFALLSAVALLVTFGAGILTGWLLFRGPRKGLPVAAVAQAAKKEEAAQTQVPAKPAGPEAPLTFYKTLPAGGKGTIGTGLNLKKPQAAPSAPVAAAPAPAAPAAATAAAAPEEKQENSAARFVVQLASYRDKQEANTAQAKLAGKGIAAYVVESKLVDKGIWYRVRVGRHLTKSEADDLAGKSGKGSLVLPE